MPRWANLANLFTLGRLLAVPFAARAILQGQHRRALIIVLVAGLTDAVDGALARRFGMMTTTGAYFDPIVDKVFLSAVYICLAASAGTPPWWLVGVIFARDFLLLASSAIAMRLLGMRRFPPSIWGKGSTFLQISLALIILIQNAMGGAALPDAAFWAVGALTALSGIHYILRGARNSNTRHKAPIDGGLARE